MVFVSKSATKSLEKLYKCTSCIILDNYSKEDLKDVFYWADDIICNISDYISKPDLERANIMIRIIKRYMKKFNIPIKPAKYKSDIHNDIKFILNAKYKDMQTVKFIMDNLPAYPETIVPHYLYDIFYDVYEHYRYREVICAAAFVLMVEIGIVFLIIMGIMKCLNSYS